MCIYLYSNMANNLQASFQQAIETHIVMIVYQVKNDYTTNCISNPSMAPGSVFRRRIKSQSRIDPHCNFEIISAHVNK